MPYQPLSIYRRKGAATPSLVKQGFCHFCKLKNRLVYSCYKNYHATGCEKKFCFDCLTLVFEEDIASIVAGSSSWRCPFARKACKCRGCAKSNWIELVGDSPVVVQLTETYEQEPDLSGRRSLERLKFKQGL